MARIVDQMLRRNAWMSAWSAAIVSYAPQRSKYDDVEDLAEEIANAARIIADRCLADFVEVETEGFLVAGEDPDDDDEDDDDEDDEDDDVVDSDEEEEEKPRRRARR